ncbi:hypothetical protein CRU87_08985 [Aliarcobacter trophiarum LMG 25534]|uniref:Membrane protein n=1 Tax=Aliarcobacter trophiarum LMG 25534 TaxID=1032241 RepID=A0AAD0QIM8_9BACT|nr:hypothetical protein [Aliarcobacter trophiarum]AXK48449.1 putative membrane protein [Aliarcobacter trophiarum LMG 25534]RXI28015.1 hypothetical protein CRU89_03140 [Aliarcobacter trophiarum]RXJ89576.1 hypothetical protein CRU87_08985 [Aliarcobacter trophiarum LMG 25534]
MTELIKCPNCDNKILSRMGTICPNCGFTVGYFNGDRRRKDYGKLFALTVFAPFFSFFTIIFAQINFYSFIIAIILAVFLAIKSCPINFKTVFATNFERLFFWNIWIFSNIFLSVIVFNIISKSI